ncbi:hypothetical protein HMPREF1992_01972 [Selenomonas sp. oral taxon 892 str. F0426]|nr:hypothetical protein HMPREF1992_01972 [Selenomonas sp. oral taxon 892 str. F0426]
MSPSLYYKKRNEKRAERDFFIFPVTSRNFRIYVENLLEYLYEYGRYG